MGWIGASREVGLASFWGMVQMSVSELEILIVANVGVEDEQSVELCFR